MNPLGKCLTHGLIVLVGGMLAWLGFVAVATDSSMYLPPSALVIVMAMYIITFAIVAFRVHARSVADVPLEDALERRRPSMVIPAVSTITLMIFIVGYAGSHPAIWTLT